MPQASETTAAQWDEIPCPWCGEPNAIPERTECAALYAGDTITQLCVHCGEQYQLRIEQALTPFARPIPK